MKSHHIFVSLFACLFVPMLSTLSACASSGGAPTDQGGMHEREQKCIASSLDRNACMQYANQRCAGGFDLFEKDAVEEDGVSRRGYYFRCRL